LENQPSNHGNNISFLFYQYACFSLHLALYPSKLHVPLANLYLFHVTNVLILKAISFYSLFRESGLFFTDWGSSPALNFGGKLHGIFAKGEEQN
jgi:hypothetical protein